MSGKTEAPLVTRPEMARNRVFVSYSHQDANLVAVIVEYLRTICEVEVIWDQTFAYGRGFHEQIRDFIAHSHVFLPVVTPKSSGRGWVHQEIGFAMAMNIPVLPIAIGATPDQMISIVHSVKIAPPGDVDIASDTPVAPFPRPADSWVWQGLSETLSKKKLDFLIERSSDPSQARYQCADYQEERTMSMVRHANVAYDIMFRGHLVRQLGGLSSFHIPDVEPSNDIWKVRYGMRERSEFHRKLQRAERDRLELHASEAGCMIIVNPYEIYKESGPRAYAVRLLCLYKFLRQWKHGMLVVACTNKIGVHESFTIVGDVFAAMAIAGSSQDGYMQTVFTTHAPSMKARHVQFDGRLLECLNAWGLGRKFETDLDPSKDLARQLRANAELCQATVNLACHEIERILCDHLGMKGKDLLSNPITVTSHLKDSSYRSSHAQLAAKPPQPGFCLPADGDLAP